MRLCYLVAALLLASCAPRYTWQNPALDPALSDHQRQIDSAECTAIAMQTVPLPNIAMPQASSQPAPRSYRVMGNTTSFGPGGITHGTFQSTVRAAPAGGSFAEVSRQMAATDALNQQRAQYDAAVRVRDDLADACMMRRGWSKVRVDQASSK